ncbi:MAG TPA: sugar ABC transporter permease [Caldilineaceae bacterium]|nr:sugar ABC transporter permease [Caldilineaceae bacterium]
MATQAVPQPQAAQRKRQPMTEMAKRQERLAYLFLLPTILVVIGVAFYPLANTIYATFFDARLGSARAWEFVGLKNYQTLLTDASWWAAVWTTVKFTVASVFLELVLGMGIALVVNSKFPGRGLMRTAMLVPWAIPTAVSSQMWKWMYHDVFGVVNDLLVNVIPILDRKIAWIANAQTALWALVAVDVWKTTPFMALLLLAGLQLIPADLYEAGSVDGATGWRQFWSITLPLLRPAIVVALIFRTLASLRVFDLVWIMTSGAFGTETMATMNQRHLIQFQRLGYGSTISVAIFLVIGIFVVFYVAVIFRGGEATQ